jgi:regulator of nucleoside diphosphate kinase
MTNLKHTQIEPPVIIDKAYYDRLKKIANSFLDRSPNVAERLLDEISRADIRPTDQMPPDVITIGSEITYRDEILKKDHTVFLVFPVDADITKQRVSVLTPIGAALIGIGKGASIDWETNSCELRHLTILDVKN